MNRKLQKYLLVLATCTLALRTTSCLPSRDAINGMISSSILNGIGLAITFAVENALDPRPNTST